MKQNILPKIDNKSPYKRDKSQDIKDNYKQMLYDQLRK